MALLTAAEDRLETSNRPQEDEEYVCLHPREEEEEDDDEEEYVGLPAHGSTEQEAEEELDEEQQVLCEGSLLLCPLCCSRSV